MKVRIANVYIIVFLDPTFFKLISLIIDSLLHNNLSFDINSIYMLKIIFRTIARFNIKVGRMQDGILIVSRGLISIFLIRNTIKSVIKLA